VIAYADCFSGISGDMALGALLDAGGEVALLHRSVSALGLENEVRLETRREQRGHLGGLRVLVHTRELARREVPQLERTVAAAALPPGVKDRSLGAIHRLAEAEARIHGVPKEELHLHELGGADTLVDLVGTFWLLETLGVTTLYCSPLPAPRGWIGEMPVPSPASLEVLARTGAILQPVEGSEELVTPTGAAILAVAARFERPAMRLERVGYGLGARERPGNALAIWVGETPHVRGDVTVIQTNLDDMAPNLIGALLEDLVSAGALDVTVSPVLMKKGRPGHLVEVLSEPSQAQKLAELVLRHSTTLGVRVMEAKRILAERQVVEVETPLGRARVKVKYIDNDAVEFSPEYEDCRRLATESGMPLREVMRLVGEAARRDLVPR
jgi:uncharacterized protein (TIGR00299 family) protein